MSAIGEKITRLYGSFRGVDFRGEEINLSRSPDSLNVWKDYKETESIRTRPGMAKQFDFQFPVYGIFFYKGQTLVHCGSDLYRVIGDTSEIIRTGLNRTVSDGFVYDDIFYFKDGLHYLQYYEKKGVFYLEDVVGYVPTTTIGKKPQGGGTPYQDVNMLTGRRKNTFVADNESVDYYLDVMNIDNDDIVVYVNDEKVTDFTVDREAGKVTFASAPNTNERTAGQDNVSIEFSKTRDGYRDVILKCSILQVFDNRVFFSGNPDYPNVVYHCSLDDPTYCSDKDYYREGIDSAQVRGLVASNNALWAFREPSESNTNVFYHIPTLDDDYGKIYPSTHSSVSLGCVGRAINFNDDIVFFSDRGMEGISGDITTEQMAAHRSSMVDRKLISETAYKDMILVEWEGYLLVIIGDKIYLADSRTAFTNENHIEYEWFYWRMEKEITCAKVHSGILYLGTEDGVYTLTDNESPIESYWVTPKDKFKYPHHQKTTNKKGCVAEATGDIMVYAKTEGKDFDLVGKFEGVTDYFVGRIKKKKFKDLQLKFYSPTRFSLETITLEAYIGAYVKR